MNYDGVKMIKKYGDLIVKKYINTESQNFCDEVSKCYDIAKIQKYCN